jgi:hypothetical protein
MKAAGEPAAASRYGTDSLFWKMFVKPIHYLLYSGTTAIARDLFCRTQPGLYALLRRIRVFLDFDLG